MKQIKIFLVLLQSINMFSQENSNVTIVSKDNHYNTVTGTLLTKDEKYIISSDETGKVLLFDTNKFDYIKTIRKSSGIPIHSMRLIKNDSVVVISQKPLYSDGTIDSIIAIRLFDNKVLFKKQQSLSFLGNTSSNMALIKSNSNYGSEIGITNNDFSSFYNFKNDKDIDIFEVSEDKKKIIYTERDYVSQKSIIIRDIASGSIVKQFPIREKTQILHLIFDTASDSFFVVSFREEDNKISIFKCTDEISWDAPVFTFPFKAFASSVLVRATKNKNDQNIIVTNSSVGLGSNPVIIEKKGDQFKASEIVLTSLPNIGLYIPSKQETVFYQNFNPNFNNSVRINIYNNKINKVTAELPKTSKEFSKAYFLPHNNWLVIGKDLNGLEYTKYFDKGTFNNRYAKLHIKDYIELKHNIIANRFKTILNTVSGYEIMSGYEKKDKIEEGELNVKYYKYDLINDKITLLFENQKKYPFLMDYNDKTKLLLLSENEFVFGYKNDSNKIIILREGEQIEFSDNYKTAKFSKNGEYLLTINDANTAEIRKLDGNKIIYSQKLDEGNFNIQIVGDAGFAICNSQFWKSTKNCSSQSLFLDVVQNNVESKIYDCAILNDVSLADDSTAILLNNQVVTLNDKALNFIGGETPLSVSLNNDASKMMVSFKTGKIIIYDGKTLKELGTMIHPDKDSHLFSDVNGNYFSNIAPEDYFNATIDNKKIAFHEIEKSAYRPEKILLLFGQPNEEYLKTLEKAIAIRTEDKTVASTENTVAKAIVLSETENLSKPNLYLLSIGVSDYKQSNYNLTFADKDANDIAQIYGKFNTTELSDYQNKFFGNVFNLRDNKNQVKSKMQKYLGEYKSIGNFYLVNDDENKWLEINNNKVNLWNFNKKRIDTLQLPKDFSFSNFGMDNQVIPFPDKSGFAMRSGTKIANYSIKNQKTELYELPAHENIALVNEKEWLIFEFTNSNSLTKITLDFYDIEKKQKNKQIEMRLNQYEIKDEKGNLKTETFQEYNLPRLRAISKNGEYVLFDINESLFLVDTKANNPIPLKIRTDIKIEYGDLVSISQDAKSFCVLKTNSDDARYTSFVAAIDNPVSSKEVFKDAENSIVGFTIFNAKPLWIDLGAPLLESNYMEASDNKLLYENSPYSFEKVFVANLINDQANSKNIKEKLAHFFEKSKPNDQVMIFLAGHGVLDKGNNYYFAPTDMDFNTVQTYGISFESLVNSLKNAPAINKLLLMDSCHSGNTLDIEGASSDSSANAAITNNEQRGSSATSTKDGSSFKVSDVIGSLFDNFLSKSGVTILSASTGSDVAYENKELGNGAFTASYIKVIKEKLTSGILLRKENLQMPVLLTKDNITKLFNKVMESTKNKQVPDLREINDTTELKLW